MKATLQVPQRELVLTFDVWSEYRETVDKIRSENRLVVKLEQRLGSGDELRVTFVYGQARAKARVRVTQVFRSGSKFYGTACEVTDWKNLSHPGSAANGPPGTQSTAPGGASAASADAAAADTPSPGGETRGSSPIFEIKRLNPSERIRLASRAKRTERQILLRDNSPQVMMALLANPRIEDKEVLEMVKSSQVSSGVLQRVAKDRRWMSNYEIQLAVVRNPKTPPMMAIRLLELLRTKDLQALAKSSHVRENLKKAALRIYLKRQ